MWFWEVLSIFRVCSCYPSHKCCWWAHSAFRKNSTNSSNSVLPLPSWPRLGGSQVIGVVHFPNNSVRNRPCVGHLQASKSAHKFFMHFLENYRLQCFYDSWGWDILPYSSDNSWKLLSIPTLPIIEAAQIPPQCSHLVDLFEDAQDLLNHGLPLLWSTLLVYAPCGNITLFQKSSKVLAEKRKD